MVCFVLVTEETRKVTSTLLVYIRTHMGLRSFQFGNVIENLLNEIFTPL